MRGSLLSLLVGACIAVGASAPNIDKIIEESARRARVDHDARERYDFSETDLQSDGSKKTFAVHMLFGSPYQELIAINGHAIPPDKQGEEKRKLREEISRRRNESPSARAKRVAKFRKDQDRDKHFLDQLTKAFDFTLLGEQTLRGNRVYVLEARPKAGYRPPDSESQVLTGMRGKLWIDQKTFEWVRVEAAVVHPVSIEGFVAKVEPGTRFELEKAPVEGGIWMPVHYAMSASAKVLGVIHHRNREDETYSNYKAASSP